MKRLQLNILAIVLILGAQACSEYLDSKPSLSLVVPETLEDFQGLLDAEPRGMNWVSVGGSIGSDEHVFGPGLIERLSFSNRNLYFWEKEIYLPGQNDANWSYPYQKIFYANMVLDGLGNYKGADSEEIGKITELEASARFYRAIGHYDLLMLFAEPFDPGRTDQLGVPIKRSSDVNIRDQRATMVEVFDQIIGDLESTLRELPDKPQFPTRPSRWAAAAMLGRVYLSMHDYGKANQFSKLALAIDDTLMDYRSLDSTSPISFGLFNPEVIFHQTQLSTNYIFNAEYFVNPDLVGKYDSADLRLKCFFVAGKTEGRVNFRGNYSGDYFHFGGLAVDEVVLNFAESAARLGNELDAVDALNYLLQHRYEQGKAPLVYQSGAELMDLIVLERRKELLFRGVRWNDLRRLNYYPELAVTLRRNYNEGASELPPGDSRYTLLIPPAEIDLNALEQNKR